MRWSRRARRRLIGATWSPPVGSLGAEQGTCGGPNVYCWTACMALSLLHLPDRPSGVVIMADAAAGIAAALAELEFATLAADLKVDEEDSHDIGLLGRRVLDVVDWARKQRALEQMPIALVGCGMG